MPSLSTTIILLVAINFAGVFGAAAIGMIWGF